MFAALKSKIKNSKLFIIFGGAFGGLGAIGAFGVCHTACTAIIAGLAIFGITVSFMPLAFLNDWWPLFIGVGIASVLLSVVMFIKHRRKCGAGKTAKKTRTVTRKIARKNKRK